MASKSKASAAFSVFPERVNLLLSVLPVPLTRLYVKLSPESESVLASVPMVAPMALFSSIVVVLKAIAVGASFTFSTVSVNSF